METLIDIAVNVAGNVVFWLVLGLGSLAFVRVTQRRITRFFGLDTSSRLTVCLANVWIPTQPGARRGYSIAFHELRGSQAISRLFGSASFRLPDAVRGLVDSVWSRSAENYRTTVSPSYIEGADAYQYTGDSLIILGGSSRNTIRKSYVDAGRVSLLTSGEHDRMTGDDSTTRDVKKVHVVATENRGAHEISAERGASAIVEKIRDPDFGNTVFFCAGSRGDTTWAATEFLVRNWRRLDREFGSRPFAVALEFPGATQDGDYMETYVSPRRIATFHDPG